VVAPFLSDANKRALKKAVKHLLDPEEIRAARYSGKAYSFETPLIDLEAGQLDQAQRGFHGAGPVDAEAHRLRRDEIAQMEQGRTGVDPRRRRAA
jgi:hypothetical protein